MNDQLEREVEETLARLATRAVPDSRRAPAPPWQEQQVRRPHRVDPRRFGRATPWLVAAVLLVIAGLGIGAAVSFDADAPQRGPAVTDSPSPIPSMSLSWDVSIGDAPSPSSDPTLSRTNTNTGPDDGVGSYLAGIGSYGPVRAGMTRTEAQTALGLGRDDTVTGYGSTCQTSVPMPGTAANGVTAKAIVDDSAGGRVVGFDTASGTVDAFGNGVGSTLADLRVSYPDGQLNYGQAGWTFTVLGADDTGLGFRLVSDAAQDQQPADSAPVADLLPGSSDYARGYELCVG